MADNDTPGAWPVWTPGRAHLEGFIKSSTIHCYTQNIKALDLVVFPIVKSMGAKCCHGNKT